MPPHVSSTCVRNELIYLYIYIIYNKLIVKQTFCASSWLIAEINNVIHVSINKQFLGFQNCFGVLSRLHQRNS